MTVRDILDACIELQGLVRIQSFKDDRPSVLYEGYAPRNAGDCLDREVQYIYPMQGASDGILVIEVRDDDDAE